MFHQFSKYLKLYFSAQHSTAPNLQLCYEFRFLQQNVMLQFKDKGECSSQQTGMFNYNEGLALILYYKPSLEKLI